MEGRSIKAVNPGRSGEASGAAVLLFDGDCGFCTTSVNWLRRVLPTFPVATPWQWADLDAMGLSGEEVTESAWLVTPRRQYGGHLTFSALLRMQPRAGLRFLGHLLATPPLSWAAGVGYHYIAKYRHRLPGGTPACQLPRPER